MKQANKNKKQAKVVSKPRKQLELSEKSLRWYSWLLPVVAVVVIVAALIVFESDTLHRIQELGLFLYTPLFFKQQMVLSGGFLSYLGCYFTQFFYHPWLGAALLGVWWLLLLWLIRQTFNIPAKWAVLTLVPIALLLIVNVDLGYWIYYLKLRGYFFVPTIGVSVAVALAWLYRLLPAKFFLRTLFVALTAAVGYPLFGCYGLFAALLMAVLAWRLDDYKPLQSTIDTVVAAVAIIAVPLIFYWTTYDQTSLANIYNTALPSYQKDRNYTTFYLPFISLGLWLVAMAVGYQKTRKAQVEKPALWILSQVAVLAASVLTVWNFWYKDENFHTELSMYRNASNRQWEEILTTYRGHDKSPSRTMWMMKNLALSRLGRQGDEMYHYRNGDTPPKAPFIARMTQSGGKLIYYNYGLINYCYRWCMEDGVEFGWHVEHYVFMLKCALLNNEMEVAQKYIDLLKKTKYYGEWAQQYEAYVKQPELVRKDPEFEPISHLIPPVNQLTSDQSLIEIFLINHFAHIYSEDPVFQEQALIFALQTKDIPTFWGCFAPYAMTLNGKKVPVHIQEAAYLYGHLENKVDISRMPFAPEVVNSYNDFMAMAQQYRNLPESEVKKLMFDRFGGTFYYEYFFTRGQHSF